MMRLVAAVVVLLAATSASANVNMHAGQLVHPEFDAVIKFHLPPPMDEYFDPYAKDGVNRDVPNLFSRQNDQHDFHKASGSAIGGARTVLGNLGGLAKLATTSIAEILGKSAEMEAVPDLRDATMEELKMLHCGIWNVETPEHIPNLEIPVMNYRGQWFGEEKLGGGWSSETVPLSDELRGQPMSDHMAKLQRENPNMALEDIMVQQGEMEKFTDEDGQQHVVAKKGASAEVPKASMLRRNNPSLI